MNSLKAVEPIHTIDLFPGLSAELLDLLKALPRSAWGNATACPGWSVALVQWSRACCRCDCIS